MVILHGSDLQVGKPYRPQVAEAFVHLAHSLGPDLIVVSGDLTQRAKAREYRMARAVLDALPAGTPVVVTPGNHDVPLWRVWERLLVPYRNWKRYIRPELDATFHVQGATVVALNSSAPRRALVAGRIDAGQVAYARAGFASAPAADVRILVTHHHFIPTDPPEGGAPLPGSPALLHAFEEMGVDVVLGGHVHQTHIQSSRTLVPGEGPGITLVACGTTASSRGRGVEQGHNTLNVIRVDESAIEVVPHRLDTEAVHFVPGAPRMFARPGAPVDESRTAGVNGADA